MTQYNIVVENPESTVVSEYQPLFRREANYQSEAELERAFIEQLKTQAYEYLPITTEQELIANLRRQLEILNDYQFSNTEWEQFFKSKIANQNNGIEEKTTIIQEDHIQLLIRDNGTVKNIYLIDKANIHNNRLQVINQFAVTGRHCDERQNAQGIAGQARNDAEGQARNDTFYLQAKVNSIILKTFALFFWSFIPV